MFYLGEYDEDEADEIRTFLGNAGIRVEVKPYLAMDKVETWALHGRYSRIKELMKEDETINDLETYLSAFRSAFPQSSNLEEFEELYLKEIDPELMENRNQILALYDKEEAEGEEGEDGESEGGEGDGREGEDEEGTNSEVCKDTEEAEETSEEYESLDLNTPEWLNSIIEINEALRFAQSVFYLNNISIGEPLGEKLDDPLLEIPVHPDDFESEPEEMKFSTELFLEKSFGLYVDEFTTPLADDIDDEFYNLFPDEYQQLKALGLLIEKLATAPSSKRMSQEEFTELCTIDLEDDKGTLRVDGKEVSMELIRILEKADILKAKGDRIKWKS